MLVLAKWYAAVVVGMLQEGPESEEARGGREESELRAHAGAGDERSSEALERQEQVGALVLQVSDDVHGQLGCASGL